jgi:heat shock protein HtpX
MADKIQHSPALDSPLIMVARERLQALGKSWNELSEDEQEQFVADIAHAYRELPVSTTTEAAEASERAASQTDLDTRRLQHSFGPLVMILGIGTVTGVFMLAIALLMSGIGILMSAVLVTWGLFLVPLWAVISGSFFANMAVDGLRSRLNVTYFSEAHPIYLRVQEFAERLELPPVKFVGWYPGEEINAFAAGYSRDHAMVGFTSGAVERLSKDQFDAIVAHELAHIANNDMRRMQYARGVQESLSWMLIVYKVKMLARWMFTFISEWAVLRLSRSREYYADAVAAVLTSPESMISALRVIQGDEAAPPAGQVRFANLMFRPNPSSFFSTHPTMNERVKALEDRSYIKKLPQRSALKSS